MDSAWRLSFPVGTRVLIRAPHSWEGEQGEVVRHELVSFLNARPAVVVRLDNGISAGVTSPDHLEVIGE